MICPNKNHPQFKALVERIGMARALAVWNTTGLDSPNIKYESPATVLDMIAEAVSNHESFIRDAIPNFIKSNQAFTTDSLIKSLYERVKDYEGGTYNKGYITKGDKFVSLLPKAERQTPIKSYGSTAILHALHKLRDKFNIDFEIIDDKTVEWKGKYLNDGTHKRVIVNVARATLDTPFHEYYHPFVRLIKNENEVLYNKMLEESGAVDEESLVQYLGEQSGKREMASWAKKFIDWLRGKFLRFFPRASKNIDQLTTLQDVLDILADSSPIDVAREETLNEAYQNSLRSAFNRMRNAGAKDSVKDTKAKPSKDYITLLVEEAKAGNYKTSDTETVYTDGQGNTYTRLTPFIGDKQLGNFSVKYKNKPDSYAVAEVKRLYKMRGIALDQPLTFQVGRETQSITFDELVKLKEQELKQQQLYGKLVHAFFNYALEENRDAKEEAFQLLYKLARDYGIEGKVLNSTELSPYVDNLSSILKSIGLRFPVEEDEVIINPDRMAPEVVIASKLLGIASTADGIVQHYNGELSIVDWKTGNVISDYTSPLMMAYGEKYNINDSKLSRAQLEVVFRALMVKEKHPDAVFRNLSIVKVDKEGNARQYKIDVEPYLGMIGDFYKDKHPEIYEQLKEKGLLDASSYLGTPVELIRVYADIEGLPYEEQVQVLQEKLNDITLKYTKDEIEGMEYLKKLRGSLTRALLELKKQPHVDLDQQSEDLDTFRSKFKNLSDVSNRQVQTLHQIKMQRDKEMLEEMHKIDMEHKKLVQAVLEEKHKPNEALMKNVAKLAAAGMLIYTSPWLIPTIFLSSYLIDRIGGKSFDTWSFMWEKSNDPARLGWFLNTSAIDPNTGQPLTKAQKAYRAFFFKNIHSTWKEVMGAPYSTTKNGKPRYKYELYGMPDTLPKDFMPRVMMDGREVRETSGFIGELRNWGKYHLTNFFSDIENGDTEKGGVPVRYFGHTGNAVVESANHSFNAEKAFSMFMGSMLRKKYYDDLLALAEGTKNSLEMVKSPYGGPQYKNLANWLNDHIYIQFMNRPQPSKFTGRKIKVPVNASIGKLLDIPPGSYEVEQEKLLRLIKSGLSHSVMGFKIVGATFNGLLITITNASQATKGLLSKAFNIPPDDVVPDIKAVSFAFAEMRNFWKASMMGKPHESKLWNLAKLSGWMPDNYDFSVGGDNLLSASKTAGFSSYAFMFNNFVESYGALWHLGMMLRSIKFTDENGKKYTAWDAYDKEGKWIKGVRGKIEVSPGIFRDLAELDGNEWKSLKREYEKLHGSYRKEEKVAIESTIWGEFVLQFKRYLPTYLKNHYSSAYKDITVGKYVLDPKGKRPNGMPVYKWEEEVMEGRYAALWGSIMAGGITPAKYKQLPKDRRKHVMTLVNTGLWFMLAWLFLAPDDDEEDTYAGWRWQRLVEDVTMGAKPLDVLHSLEKPVIVLTKVSDIYEAFWDYLTGVATGDRTRKGDIKGEKTLISSIPPFSNFYQLQQMADKSVQGTDYVFGIFPVDIFEGSNR